MPASLETLAESRLDSTYTGIMSNCSENNADVRSADSRTTGGAAPVNKSTLRSGATSQMRKPVVGVYDVHRAGGGIGVKTDVRCGWSGIAFGYTGYGTVILVDKGLREK